jgi:hypothetical protein
MVFRGAAFSAAQLGWETELEKVTATQMYA